MMLLKELAEELTNLLLRALQRTLASRRCLIDAAGSFSLPLDVGSQIAFSLESV